VTIGFLQQSYSRWGLPLTLVSDNATNFTSEEFKQFMKSCGTRHVTGAVYHQSTNGAAENAVKIFKRSLTSYSGEGSIQVKINLFLTKYRLTPHTTTGVCPAELTLGRRPRTTLDLLRPEVAVQDRILKKQDLQRQQFHKGKPRQLDLHPNDTVMTRNYGRGPKWKKSKILKKTGPISYKCATADGTVVKRHQDQIWKRPSSDSENSSDESDDL
jgi:hypothetical protein